MRLALTHSLEAGDRLGKTIYNENGKILLRQGVTLTDRMIGRLSEFHITYVYIEDPDTDDIESHYPITEELRTSAVQSIKKSFATAQDSDTMKKGFVFDKSANEMTSIVRSIMDELRNHKEAISLLSDVFTYDDYIFTHSLNVTMYALALGKQLQLPYSKLEQLGIGAILHDVGKMMVPRDVLLKPGRLSNSEFELIKTHAEAGFELLRSSSQIPLVAAHCAFQHHERMDGSGYPRGLAGDEIHYFGKILAVADVFDAVTSNRVYRAAMLPHEGLEILYSGAGTLFDQEMVEAFRKCIAIYPNGLSVELNDGRKGIVVSQNPALCDRPIIRIFEEDGYEIEQKYDIDLSEQLSVVVKNCDTISVG
ncbi:HD-GYP domain-containing protein [Halobacillus litoralis]|uniref:HD-GYP domain-containing protein n=1 Tax=Halobacillus litoralis TaxID=45668 RepID=UPI001CD5E6BA|nr:HD-GYP domain-containing protein [Halobacillus litoralis]MCA0971752.1 HD-GYP domain-containing protein [Halobacillus litoralis]